MQIYIYYYYNSLITAAVTYNIGELATASVVIVVDTLAI